MATDTPDPDRPVDWERYEREVGPQPGSGWSAPEPPDADPDHVAVLVDGPEAQHPRRSLRDAERRPIVPTWLRSRADLGDAARWTTGLAAHLTAYHASRTPKYAGRLALRAPVGGLRVVVGWVRWALDLEGEPVRQASARREDAESYLKLAKQRDRRVRWRTGVSVLLLALLLAALVGLVLAPPPLRLAGLAGLVAVLGLVGRPADRPLLDTAVVVAEAPRLTSDMVVGALRVLGVTGINQALAKNPRAIGFTEPITREGPGWRAVVNLPPGVTASEVIKEREKLASGLGRPLGCVWPEAAHEIHPGRLVLWVGDKDMASVRPTTGPLAKRATVDLFRPFPFGTDPRGRPVELELVFTNLLIGAIPRQGKTFSLRVALLAAALDPYVEEQVFELKGTGDLQPLALVASRYASGNDDDTVEEVLAALRWLRKECGTRATIIKGLPRAVCPENKVTPELARRKGSGLHLLVVAVDEVQELFSHPEYGKEAAELAEKIIKLGPALGIVLLLATQRPDKASLPTGVSANVGTRLCLRVMGHIENDMVLGTSAHQNGIRATMFTKRDKGVGYLVGAADDPQIVRGDYYDGPAAERICQRARESREKAGTLSGHAAGQAPARESRDTLLEDILTVVPAAEAKVWNQTTASRLAELRPEVYGGWRAEQVAVALKPYGITVVDVWGKVPDGEEDAGKDTTRRGFARQAVVEAATERDRRRRAA